MNTENLLVQAFVYLAAGVISVPIARRLGVGSVLGYLVAGMIIGPFGLDLVGQQTDVMHFAEFGVVMMLFLIGLELEPSKLWTMRGPILGAGGGQVLLTGAAIAGVAIYFGYDWRPATAIGMMLALSSTAIVLQTLEERGWRRTDAGRNIFSVLLFQDIAVIPMLAVMPLLALAGPAAHGDSHGADAHAASPLADLPPVQQGLLVVGAIVGLILIGRFLSRPIFRFIAGSGLREIFTAAALLLVTGIALLMGFVGLSPALGAFVAGVVLSESEFRHELETDIEPFKGLLLGLFFITVGASFDAALIVESPVLLLAAVSGLVAIKFIVLLVIGALGRYPLADNLLFAFALAQGGEFAFVLSSYALTNGVLTNAETSVIIAAVALSMAATPLLLLLYTGVIRPRLRARAARRAEADAIDEADADVIIAGYGRFGQIIGRLLSARGFKLVILDHSASQIELLRKFGNKVYFGDASRVELLRAAGAEHAKLFVCAVDDIQKGLEIVDRVKEHFPHLQILARAVDRRHGFDLMKRDITSFRRESFHSALELAGDALTALGYHPYQAERAKKLFAKYDEQTMRELADSLDNESEYISAVRRRAEQLSDVLSRDQATRPGGEEDQSWEKPPRRPDAEG